MRNKTKNIRENSISIDEREKIVKDNNRDRERSQSGRMLK